MYIELMYSPSLLGKYDVDGIFCPSTLISVFALALLTA